MRALDHNLNHVHDCLFSAVPCRLILHNKYNSWYEIAWHDIHMCGPGWWSRFTSGQFVITYLLPTTMWSSVIVSCCTDCMNLQMQHACASVAWRTSAGCHLIHFPHTTSGGSFIGSLGPPRTCQGDGETPAPGRLHLLVMIWQHAAHGH